MSSVSHPATVFLFGYLSCTRNLTKPHCFGEENEKNFPGAQPPDPLPSSDTTQTPPTSYATGETEEERERERGGGGGGEKETEGGREKG